MVIPAQRATLGAFVLAAFACSTDAETSHDATANENPQGTAGSVAEMPPPARDQTS